MKRCVALGLLLLFVGATIALAGEPGRTPQTTNNIVLPASGATRPVKAKHLDEVIYYEDWESGLNGWVSNDLTATPGTWHIDSWNAFGGTGMSWCMGQHPVYCDTVGYLDDWYMVLDSPPIVLPAGTCSLTFWHRIACEPPGGEPPGYNGWDGCNIRISTNDGASWSVITNDYIQPDYDRSSLYSFGFQHGEGTGIPGWVGNTHMTWFYQTASLTPWAGQTVRLRWAFASDPAWCTCYSATTRWAFGWQVDDIRVFAGADTVFSNNGDSDTGWYSHSNQPIGGDLWRVADDCNPPPCPPPSGSHYIVPNDSMTRLYNNDMNNEFVSPYIDLRGLDFGTLQADFLVAGAIGSPCNNFPEDCDYWHWEVSPDSGLTWYFASNPCDQGIANYVHPDAPDVWALYSQAYQSGFDMSCYIGSVVKLRVIFESDEELVGVGPCFDDLTLTYTAGFPNDMSCYSLQVRFPTTMTRPTYGTAYIINAGSQAQTGVPAWWTEGVSNHRLMPNIALQPNQTTTRSFTWTPAAIGTVTISAWTALDVEQFFANDTSYCPNIEVRESTTDLEMGYDNRTIQYRFNFETGQGAMVKFTPTADSIDLPLNLNVIRMQFDSSQTGTKDIGLRIFRDAGGVPGEAVFWGTVTVTDPTDVYPLWREVIVDGQPGVHGINGDFWVWLEVLDTNPNQRFPQILGDDAEPWLGANHYFTYRRGDTLVPQPYFFFVRALVTEGTSESPVQELAPVTYSLNQNYPNPFNPVTEINYSIARTEKVSLRVFNLLGQEVAVLVDGVKSAGVHKVSFNGSQLPSGIYMYRLETDSHTLSKKMVLMK